jgi:uncharacterized protein
MDLKLAGIDYGSKLAGTTVLAFYNGHSISLFSTAKGVDADVFLEDKLGSLKPDIILIDAPLNIPGIYGGLPKCDNFFYRHADKELQAMSPMFLGGLTARAMKLAYNLHQPNIKILEAYPKKVAETLGLKSQYLKSKNENPALFIPHLQKASKIECPLPEVKNWHEADALLCLITAIRISRNQAISYGRNDEGLIWI